MKKKNEFILFKNMLVYFNYYILIKIRYLNIQANIVLYIINFKQYIKISILN